MKKIETILSLDIEQVYNIVNVLSDSCNCSECQAIVSDILCQLRNQRKVGA